MSVVCGKQESALPLTISSGGARIWVEGGQNLYKIYAFYAHISYVFKKKKNRNNKYVK